MSARRIGVDIGKISFKAVLMNETGQIERTFWKSHQQEIKKIWQELRRDWQISETDRIVVTGRFRKMLSLPSIVEKVAQERALRLHYPDNEITLISLGGGGFSVLRTRSSRSGEFKRNPRCAAGVGSFLDQILARVGLNILEVDQITENVKGLEITSRCGVTMKTDFTHLLNQGNRIEEVIAGLLDSSARNVVALALKSRITSKILLVGGLSVSKRIVRTVKESLPEIEIEVPPHALYFEALGAALVGSEENLPHTVSHPAPLTFLPGLKNHLHLVTKIDFPEHRESRKNLILGLDIGSTGSKLVLLGEIPIFEVYGETKGQPVEAAKELIQQIPPEHFTVIKGVGCTGSGREIVASLLRASLPEESHQQIFVLNEIAAHAHGALYYDAGVDTVVDIGGQDAKFIRLEKGRVVDSCMNTVCSAGTGSFLAEQLQLLGLKDIRQLGEIALNSPRAVDLGQHCAVFVAEQIDEAKRKGAQIEEIVAGLYYSIILNYNNRVKGLRDYGQRIFLQGKPAENLALACALARVTGQPIVVPPSPGSMGALGIALLAKNEFGNLDMKASLVLEKFLESKVLDRKEFRCQSRDGCLEGNLCPIQVITVSSTGQKSKFFWGGACDKYEKTGKSRVISRAPRPFLEREKLILGLINHDRNQAKKTIGIVQGLETEEILPLTITFFQELGHGVKLPERSSLKFLEQGAKLCQATFCAPLQLLAGKSKSLESEDYLFIPKVIEIPGLKEERRCYVCPLSQASPDLFSPRLSLKVLSPFLNFKDGYQNNRGEFLKLGLQLGSTPWKSHKAFKIAVEAQERFEHEMQEAGKRAITFARRHHIPIVVVLGHPYIIHSSLLSAGIPEVIQEKGAIALPADCYPLNGETPILDNIYWGYGQRLLRLASEIRQVADVFPLWLSVYSCGPDSFLLHFFQYLSQGKPYTILETDAYTGQAGFKTRIEAFLYNIHHYQAIENHGERSFPDLRRFEAKGGILSQIEDSRKALIPRMGEGARILAALFKAGLGIESEALPVADQEALETGRKFTSGKECFPMIVTVGNLLKNVRNSQEHFYYFMPQAGGPCRFGQYHLLTKIILEKAGLAERVKVISPDSETGYRFSERMGSSMIAKAWSAIVFVDLLRDALFETRPSEKLSGDADGIFEKYLIKTEKTILETPNEWSGYKNLWGIKNLAKMAAEEFKEIPQNSEKKPRILLTGEIYVRLDDFSNNYVIRELEALGMKVKLAPFREWINYTTFQRRKRLTTRKQKLWKVYLTWFLQRKIEYELHQIFSKVFNWPEDHSVEQILKAARPYLSRLRPLGESALTIGLPLLLWQKREIAGTIVVGPFECMPTRIAETQLALISEQTGLPVLNISFSGEPLDKELLESFVWDLRN
ncbi:MAG: BadF/BadG/BcrA/BcrD ATPase family protein [Nitrospirota bacterium]